MHETKAQALQLLRQFKGDNYIFGVGCFDRLGELVAPVAKRIVVVADGAGTTWGETLAARALQSLKNHGCEVVGVIPGAKPNAPTEDVLRLAGEIRTVRPDAVVAMGGGSVIDAVKAAIVLADINPPGNDLEPFFGMGKVTEALKSRNRKLTPLIAVQIASSSAAHLTKYANTTNTTTWQKKLIIDDAIIPARALFDYALTTSMPRDFTADGAFDGLSHALEVYVGTTGDALSKATPVCLTAIDLIVGNIRKAVEHPTDAEVREAIGLGTDLGGYAIMIGGTNGAHLNSFSLVDILSHGRACALVNPYYIVFFAPAIEPQLREVASILTKYGFLRGSESQGRKGRELGIAVASAMMAMADAVGFPTRLNDVPGFTPQHIARALAAAKNPQLESKLNNMPVPLSAATVDEFMGSVLNAAVSGDFNGIRNL